MFRSKRKKIAFTLAEVLITLGIIGVVAAMTIPALISNTQNQQYVTGFKKAYSTWNQAVLQMANDSGCPDNLACFFDTNFPNILGDKLLPYFKTVKVCHWLEGEYGCFPDSVAPNIDGTSVSTGWERDNSLRFITADGMSIQFYNPSAGCTSSNGTGHFSNLCVGFYIDVNGLKKPNTLGRDIFDFNITNGKGPAVLPVGLSESSSYWQTGSCNYGYNSGVNKDGESCGARIMEEGWQMKY